MTVNPHKDYGEGTVGRERAVLWAEGYEAMRKEIQAHLEEAETKAWDSLAKYKFQMFGYWAAIWVHLNRIGGFKRGNPWKGLVKTAKDRAKGGSA